MTWTLLECGIHESKTPVDPCPACAAAAKQTKAEVDQYLEEQGHARAAQRAAREARKARAQEARQQEEEAMASQSRFTEEQKAEALRRRAAGESSRVIAESLGCSPPLVDLWRKQAAEALNGAIAKPPKPKATKPAPKPKAPTKKPTKAPKGVAVDLVVNDGKAKAAKVSAWLDSSAKAAKTRPHTVADPAKFAHEDVIAFLARLPPMPWALGDAIRLLAFHAIDGDFDDITQARERIDAHLRAAREAA